MRDHGVSFKQALNDAIREALAPPAGKKRFRTRTADLGVPTVGLDRALALAGEMEDEELVRRMRAGK